MYSIYDHLGQFSFQATPPLYVPGGRFDINFQPYIRQAQATRFQPAAAAVPPTPDSFRVRVSISGGPYAQDSVVAEGVTTRNAWIELFKWARTPRGGEPSQVGTVLIRDFACSRGSYLNAEGNCRHIPFETTGSLLVFATPQNVAETLRILGLQPRLFLPGMRVAPSASVRSRGGFATLFGVAAGYALGGLPGAAVGAAVSRLVK